MAHKLPVLVPYYGTGQIKSNMQQNAAFVVTRLHVRSDLGGCVVSTTPPHYVAKLHDYRLRAKKMELAERYEEERLRWFDNVLQAYENGRAAHEKGMSVRAYVEQFQGKTYDEELDEPRMIAKVPGMNTYLELYGCLDAVNPSAEDCEKVLGEMAFWYRRFIVKEDVRASLSAYYDEQLMDQWREDGDDAEFFPVHPKHGIGIDHIDPTRRGPVYQRHNFSPREKAEYDALKEARARGENALSDAELQRLAVKKVRENRSMEKNR